MGVPVLIHLINMLRHRRVRWAAMEFLLLSQKKNRTWVLLKQLLLLLLRMAAVAAVVLIVAQPRLRSAVGPAVRRPRDPPHRALGRQLLDVRPLGRHQRLEQAKGVVGRIGKAVAEEGPQTFTLLRFSQAGRGEPRHPAGPARRDRSTASSPSGWRR